jgi:phage gpG-like protein
VAAKVIQVDDGRVVIGLKRFQLSLEQNEELMRQIGTSQLASIRRTFRDEGVPAGSWARLAPSTIARNPKLYGAGHKLLVRSGRLLNSINVRTVSHGMVVIGTNLVYAGVHQRGSRDRGVAIGPRTAAEEQAQVSVRAHERYATPYGSRLVLSARPSMAVEGPVMDGKRRKRQVAEGPRMGRYDRVRLEGPARRSLVGSFQRHQNIPPRPYLVFRPEDPARIRGIAQRYVLEAEKKAGLGGAE